MCRYAYKTYKSHFACFACNKMFKKAALSDYMEQKGLGAVYSKIVLAYSSPRRRKKVETEHGVTYDELVDLYLRDVSSCPECGGSMAAMGLDFRPPPKKDIEAWAILKELYEHGYAFRGCGCMVGFEPPAKLKDLPFWLGQHAKKADGEKLLEKILLRG